MKKLTLGDTLYEYNPEFKELWIRGKGHDLAISTDPRVHALFSRVLELEETVVELKAKLHVVEWSNG